MSITPQEAKAELQRRARAELERREMEEEQSLLSKSKRALSQGARNVAAGVGDVLDVPFLPIEAARYGIKKAGHAIAPKYVSDTQFGESLPHIGEKVARKIDELTGGYTAPRNSGERLRESTQRALTSLPAGLGFGTALKAMPAMAKLGKGLTNISMPTAGNIGATAGGAAAAQQYAESSADPSLLGSMGYGLLGSTLGGVSAPMLTRVLTTPTKDLAAKAVGRAANFSPEKYARVKELGLAPTLGITSDSPIAPWMEGALSKYPGTSKKMYDVFNKRESALARKLGVQNPDLHEVIERPQHELAKQGATAYKTAKDTAYEKTIAPYESLEKKLADEKFRIPSEDLLKDIKGEYGRGVHTPLEEETFHGTFPGAIHKKIKKSAAEASRSSPELAQAVNTVDLTRKALKQLNIPDEFIESKLKDILPKEVELIKNETENLGSSPSLYILKDLKKEAQAKKENYGLSTRERGEATHLHGKLKEKIWEGVEPFATPQEKDAYIKANKEFAEYAAKKQSNMKHYVEELLKVDGETEAFQKLTKHHKFLDAASHYLPSKDKPKLLEAMMATFGKSRQQGRFNIANAHSAFTHWKPQVQESTLNLLPTEKARENFMNAMKWIGKNKEEVSKLANTSGTSYSNALLDLGRKLGNIATGLGSAAIGAGGLHYPLEAAGTLLTLDIGARATAKMWTNPLFLERMNKVIKSSNSKKLGNHLDLLLKTPSVKQVLKGAANPLSQPLSHPLDAGD